MTDVCARCGDWYRHGDVHICPKAETDDREDPPARRGAVLSLVERRPPEPPEWTPEQLLVEFLEDIRAGKVKPINLMVFFAEETPDGDLRPQAWSSNVGYAEAIAFLTAEIHRTVEAWRN